MKVSKIIIAAITLFAAGFQAKAQYYEIANTLPSLIRPALSGSLNYKGFVEVTGLGGIGQNRANFIGLSTSQGFQYTSWFYMGAGIGIDVAMARNTPAETRNRYVNTMAVLPVFTDFRFNIPVSKASSFFIDAKFGAAWFLGNNYINLYDGTISHSAQFFLQPTVGIRVPVNSSNSRQAINFGVTYRLLTSNNNYDWSNNTISLNNFGASISFEW